MAIKVISEGMRDTPHAIYEAQEIIKTRPDAVFVELPMSPFQGIFDAYNSGRIKEEELKSRMARALGKPGKKVDHTLASKFLAGQVSALQLEEISREGRNIHVAAAAKKAGAKIFAMDMPVDALEEELSEEAEAEHIKGVKAVLSTKKLPQLIWELNEIVHYPFYVIERLLRHHAIITTNPYVHNVNYCGFCYMGSAYDRAISSILFGILNFMPLSKGTKLQLRIAYLLRKVDYMREKYMAAVIAEKYKELKNKLGREPKVVAIMHLWSAPNVKWILRDLE